MSRKKLPYQEGDWFAVPLRDGGYGIGLIARARRTGKALCGYFFGPWRKTVPPLTEVSSLRPADAILICIFGDLSLYHEEWPIIGHSEPWDRGAWPMPTFARIDDDGKKAWKVEFAEDDPSVVIREVPCSVSVARRLPKDDAMGSGAVEIVLGQLLRKLLAGSSHKDVVKRKE